MVYPVYSYRDAKVGFGAPTIDLNDQTAIRLFSYKVNNSDGLMGFAAQDWDLYKIGTFDSEKGVMVSETPVLVVSGSSVYGAK